MYNTQKVKKMGKNPGIELKRIKKQRDDFIYNHLGSKIKNAKEYGILTNSHRCYFYSHKFTNVFIDFIYERIIPNDSVILNDLKSLRFDDHYEPTLCYLPNSDKGRFGYSGGPLNEAYFKLWERIKVLIPIISEAMEDWIITKKKEKLNRMTKNLDKMTQSPIPYVKYKLTKIEVDPDEENKTIEKKENEK